MKVKPEITDAINAINKIATSPNFSYEQTREVLLVLHAHIDHILTHFPVRQKHNYEYGGG